MRTVAQIARASGISVRALHHYDRIGLLKPEIGENGYRYYGKTEVLRLQQILFYRELGLPLATIAEMLDDPSFDMRTALLDLRQRVESEIDRYRELANTIDRTLSALDHGSPMNERRLFDGVSSEKKAAWELELVSRYGEHGGAAIRQAATAVSALTAADFVAFKQEIDAIHAAFIELIDAAEPPDGAAAQSLVARHHSWLNRTWYADAPAYAALGRFYLEHDEFRSMYDNLHPHLARFLADGMAAYAERSLARRSE